MPIPKLSEKNACPNALNTPSALNLEKSGLNKNDRPSPAPGSVMARMSRITIISNKTGIKILEAFSMPPLMPANTIQHVRPINTNCQNMGRITWLMNPPNIPSKSAGFFPANELITAFPRYSNVQPATTP